MPADESIPAIITPEPPQIEQLQIEPPPPPRLEIQFEEMQTPPQRGIAPIWHTMLLVLGILGYSIWGGLRPDAGSEPISAMKGSRIFHYALSGVFELALVGWVALGLWLRKVHFRTLLGALPRGLNSITLEIGISALFWFASMIVLATVGLTWTLAQDHVYQRELAVHTQQHARHEAEKSKGHHSPTGSTQARVPTTATGTHGAQADGLCPGQRT